MPNKVKYGLSNVYYAPLTEAVDESGNTTYTYETPVRIPGGVELSLEAKGETTAKRADNVNYYVSVSNNGYEGDLTIVLIPESFRIVFQMPPSARDRFVAGKIPGIYPDQVGGLYINIQYENHEMICVTGTSMKQFTMDRTLENEWDENVRKFLRKNGVAVS